MDTTSSESTQEELANQPTADPNVALQPSSKEVQGTTSMSEGNQVIRESQPNPDETQVVPTNSEEKQAGATATVATKVRSDMGRSPVITRSKSYHMQANTVVEPEDSVSNSGKTKSSRNTKSHRSGSSRSSRSSARARKATLLIELNNQRQLNELEIQQFKERMTFEKAEIHRNNQQKQEELQRLKQKEQEDLLRHQAREEKEIEYRQRRREIELQTEIHKASVELELTGTPVSNQTHMATEVICDSAEINSHAPHVSTTNTSNVPLLTGTKSYLNVACVCNNISRPIVPVNVSHISQSIPENYEKPKIVPSFCEENVPPKCDTNLSIPNVICTPTTHSNDISFTPTNKPYFPSGYQKPPGIPKREPPIFYGNPASYPNFIIAFDTIVSKYVDDPRDKLFYLSQYTGGSAQELVKGCFLMPPNEGFETARQLLQEYFGQRHQIAHACLDTIVNGPAIHVTDKQTLLQFSAKLKACMNTLESINYLYNIDNMETITKILKRLPTTWQGGWLQLADEILHNTKNEISIKDLSKYVHKKTRESTCYIYESPSQMRALSATQMNYQKPRGMSFATRMTTEWDNVPGCKLCDGMHYLNQCAKFRSWDFEVRKKFVTERNLCFSCLDAGHIVRDCFRQHPCSRPNCTGRHSTLLHPPDFDLQQEQSITKPKSADPVSKPKSEIQGECISAATSAKPIEGNTPNLLPILPVKIRVKGSKQTIITQAFLDNGSTSSFITESIMNKLGVHGPVNNIWTSTINGDHKHKRVKVIKNLELLNLDETICIPLNHMCSNSKLPASSAQIPCQDDVDQYKEFKDIHIPEVSAEVGLLIGNDNVKVLQPQNVIRAANGHYAIKTSLGWIINCPSKKIYSRNSSFSNKKKKMSVEQQTFMQRLSKSTKHTDHSDCEINLPIKNQDLLVSANKIKVEQRPGYLRKKFLRKPSFHHDYQLFRTDMITKCCPSAKFKENYLNDNHLQGPDWLPFRKLKPKGVTKVLSHFRKENVAVTNDIQAMLNHVKDMKSAREEVT